MSPIQNAIVLLNIARDELERERISLVAACLSGSRFE